MEFHNSKPPSEERIKQKLQELRQQEGFIYMLARLEIMVEGMDIGLIGSRISVEKTALLAAQRAGFKMAIKNIEEMTK